MTKIQWLFAATLLAMPLSLHAEEAQEATDVVSKAVLKRVSEDSASTSAIAGTNSKVAIEASSEKTTAAFKVGISHAVAPDLVAKLALSAKAPLDISKDDHRDFATLSGLTAGSSAQFETGLLFWPVTDPVTLRSLDDQVCHELVPKLFPGLAWWRMGDPKSPDSQNFNDPLNYAYVNDPRVGEVSCTKLVTEPAYVAEINKKREERHKTLFAIADKAKAPKPDFPEVKATEDLDYIKLLQRKARAQLYTAQANAFAGGAHGVTLTLSGNRQAFTYASAAAPSSVSEDSKEGYGAALAYSYIGHSYVAAAGAGWEKAYEGGEETEICNPIGTTGSLSCANGSLAAPTKDEDTILFTELRKVGIIWGHGVATSPRVEFGLEHSAWAVRVPVYLAPDPKHVLDGGIAIGWTSDDQWGVSVFAGKSFSFFD